MLLTMRALKRLATLERQLQRYLAQHQHLPPSKSARSAKFRATLKRHVVTQNIRNQRCLRAQGNEIGWRGTRLTPADQQRIEVLLRATEPAYYARVIAQYDTKAMGAASWPPSKEEPCR